MSELPELIINKLKIDPLIFTFPFGCKCNGECCNYGVYADLKEYETILSIKDKIIPHMDETQPTDSSVWFEAVVDDDDFESGKCAGTEVHNGKCVFLDSKGLCSIQKLAIAENVNPWFYKPLYCILFPLTIFEGALTIDSEHIDRLHHCNKVDAGNFPTMFESCKQEIIHLFGEENYQQMVEYKDKYILTEGKV